MSDIPATTETTAPTTDGRSAPPTGGEIAERIVFFDGVCGLCNHTVDFLLRRDRDSILKFAPLQGPAAAELLPDDVRERLDTMAYYRQGTVFYRSAAVLRVLRDLGGFVGAVATLLWVIPAPIMNIGYRCVSALRYRLFGRHEACRIPTADERARFLD